MQQLTEQRPSHQEGIRLLATVTMLDAIFAALERPEDPQARRYVCELAATQEEADHVS